MKDTHLSLRIPESLVVALETEAKERGLPRSAIVREAVSAYVASPREPSRPLSDETQARPRVLAHELAAHWSAIPIFSEDPVHHPQADTLTREMAKDIAKARSELLPSGDPWA